MEREGRGGIGMGNTCKPMAVSFQCMTKSTTIKKKEREKKRTHIYICKCIHLYKYKSVCIYIYIYIYTYTHITESLCCTPKTL